jgi:hypothetical protein
MRKLKQGIGVVVYGVALFAARVAPADNPGHDNGNGTSSTSTSTAAGPDTAPTTATLPSQAKGYGPERSGPQSAGGAQIWRIGDRGLTWRWWLDPEQGN